MIKELSKTEKRYVSAVRRLFNTPDGLFVLKCWKADYYDVSALCERDNSSFYAMGQKEFVQELLGVIKDEVSFQELRVDDQD